MRHSIKRISKSALSVILALMMVVSTMVVGIVTVSAFDLQGTYNFDNYTAKWDKVYLVKVGNDGKHTEYQAMTAGSNGIYSYTLGSWGGSSFYFANSNSNPTATTAKFTSAVNSTNNCFVPSSATGTSITGTWMTTAQAIQQHGGGETETAKFNGGDVYYLQPNSNWQSTNAWFAICLQSPISGSTDKTFVKMDQVTGASPVTYKVTIPDGGWNNMDFVRMNKDKTELSYNSKWNSAYTGNSGVGYPSGTQNCLQITGWDNSGTWSTFVDKKDLAVPTVTLTTNGVITSDTPVTLNITSSGDAYPNGATFELVNSSGTTIDNITLSLGNNTLSFSDKIPDGNYKVKVSADEAAYNPASSTEFSLKSVQLYGFTINDDGDSDVTVSGTYLDAYGSSQNVAEGQTVLVPENGEVTVTANITAANKEFTKFTYNGTDYTANNAKIPVTANGTLTTTVETVTMQTIKIAAVRHIVPEYATDVNKLSANPKVSYTAGNKTGTADMTKTDDEVYFYISGTWTNAQIYYVYTVSVPSNTTIIKIDDKGSNITLDASKDYYAFYNFGGWKSTPLTESDRYYPVEILADTTVDKGATVDYSVDADVNKKNLDNTSPTKTVYKYGTSITLKATPSNASAFSLEKWNDGTSDITSPYTVVGDATLTAYFKANQTYAINLVDTVANLSSITSSPATSTYEGNTVKLTVTPDTGYECTGLTVTGNSTSTSVSVIKNDDGTYSFTMPGEAVTVTPTISAKTVANITVSSNNDEYGTAVLSTTGKIYVGDTFDVTVTPATNYALSGFTITGGSQGATSGNTTTFTAKSQNVSVTANFTKNLGQETTLKLIYGTSNNPKELTSSLPIYKLSDGSYIAKFTGVTLENNKTYYFALSSSTSYTDMYWKGNSNVPVTSADVTRVSAEKQHYGLDNVNYYFGWFKITSDDVTDITILVGNDDGNGNVQEPNYVVTPKVETLPEGTAKVYAKDGTTIDGGTHNYGDTKVVTSATIKLKSELSTHNIYSAEKDSYLTIQTTMDSTYSGYGFYVYAFCINGESYPAVAKAGGVYETTYKVTGKEESSIVEITPVYYNTNVENAGDYISVYVDASQLKGKWGNTISCYSYYYYSDKNAYETTPYPGQPMLLGTNGLYYTRVPRYAYENGVRKVNSEGNPYAVSGVTLNSFSEHELHGTLYSNLNGKNYQTYDYDDFKYIADLGFDTVKFVIEYRDKTTNQSTLLENGNTAPDKSGSTITPSVYAGQNGWNDFYDFDGNKTDILGNVLKADQQTSSPIYVVSTGNQNTSMGEWSTVWYVFDQSGKYVTQGIPSDFITRNADGGTTKPESPAYQAIDKARLKGVPVRICYESEQTASTSTDTGNSGVRVDGRWYYTTSTQDAPVDVIVQYRDNTSQDVWTTDTTGVSGTATIDGVTKKIFTERNVTAQLNAVAKSGYVFVEWGTVDDNGEHYTKLSNIKSASAEFMIDTSYHLVARFEKVQNGSLVISHEKYTGPNFVGGGGYYLVSAVVYNADGSVYSTYDLTEGSITIPNLASLKDNNCTIKIKMVTKMKGDNKFIDWYMLTPEGDYDNITQEEAVWGATGEVSQEVTVAVNELYSGSELVVNTFQYYSDIAKVTKDAVLNYKYYNRFGEERTYIVTVKLDDEYIQNNGYEITDKLIYDNAPAIEDLYKDCIWTITAQSTTRNSTTATIWGTHNKVTYNVTLDDGINEKVAAKVEYSKYLTNPNTDAFYTAPAEKNSVSFAYWLVEENGKEVARCYANEFNLKILGNYTITAVYADEKNSSLSIVGPTYTREQFTDDAGNVKSDYLYVDFIVAYMNSYGILLNGDLAKDMNYHTGLIIEFDRNIKVTDEDLDNAKLSKPLTDYAYDDYSGIDAIATSSEKTSGSLTVDGNRALYKFEIDNAGYNNKNRIDYYVKFNNTKSFRHYVMKAYYYVYYTDKNGKTVFQKTAPVYFCLFEIGNSTADLS